MGNRPPPATRLASSFDSVHVCLVGTIENPSSMLLILAIALGVGLLVVLVAVIAVLLCVSHRVRAKRHKQHAPIREQADVDAGDLLADHPL